MEISHPMISDQVYEKTLERSLIFAHLHLETVKGKKRQFFWDLRNKQLITYKTYTSTKKISSRNVDHFWPMPKW